MSKCSEIQNLLADYRTQLVSGAAERDVERHLAECAECANELRVLDGVLELVADSTPQYAAPPGLWNGVYSRITEQKQATPRESWAHRWFGQPIRAAAAGLAAAVVIGGFVAGAVQHSRNTPQSTTVANSEYVQGHALYAAQTPLADTAAYLALVAETGKAK